MLLKSILGTCGSLIKYLFYYTVCEHVDKYFKGIIKHIVRKPETVVSSDSHVYNHVFSAENASLTESMVKQNTSATLTPKPGSAQQYVNKIREQ